MKRNRTFSIEQFEEEWTCPITSQAMEHPVLTLDGHSYEKSSIEDWLKKKMTSPKTNKDLQSGKLIPNITLKNVIEKYNNEMKHHYLKINQQNDDLKTQKQKLQQKLKDSNKDKKKAESEYNELKNKFSQLSNNLKKATQSTSSLKKQLETFKSENQTLKQEKNQLKTQNKSIQSLKNESKILKQQAQKTKKQQDSYKLQIQILTQQKAEIISASSTAKQELAATKKTNEELKILLKKQLDAYNPMKVKVQDYDRLMLTHQDTLVKYEKLVEDFQNLSEKVQKISLQTKPFSLTTFTKDQQIQKLKLSITKLQIENNSLNNEIKTIRSDMDKLKLENDKLKAIQAFYPINQEKEPQKQPIKENGLAGVKPQKIIEEKRQRIDILNFIKPRLSDIDKKPQFISEKVQVKFQKFSKEPEPIEMKKSQKKEQIPQRNYLKDLFSFKKPQPIKESLPLRNFLPYGDYLMSNPVLYDEQKHELDHSNYKIDMEDFLKHNWSELKTLNLSQTQLDDRGFQLLTSEATSFSSLSDLWICKFLTNLGGNFIVNVEKGALDGFKSLKTLFFSIKGKHPNPLSEESKAYLNDFSKRRPSVQVAYHNKPI